MSKQELHDLLVSALGLVPELAQSNVSRTYFYDRIDWYPGRSTRVFRVLFGPDGEPECIQLCASSDNNNSVLVQRPFHRQRLTDLAVREIALIEGRELPAVD